MAAHLYGINILDILGELQLERMGISALEQFAQECRTRAAQQPDNDRGCWLTEIYIELCVTNESMNNAVRLFEQQHGACARLWSFK